MSEQAARDHISSIYNKPEGEFGPTLFVEHHLEELSKDEWVAAVGRENPQPNEILNALVLLDAWDSEGDGTLITFDFTLPGHLTNYLISVRFDGDKITEDSMES